MAGLNMALLLKESLNNMRGKLGKDCTYLAFEKEGRKSLGELALAKSEA